MQIEPLGLVLLALGCLGFLAGTATALPIFAGSTLLGASAAIILPSLGGASIQPAHLLLGFLICSAAIRAQTLPALRRTLAFPNEGFWLLLTAAYAAIAAVLLPRLFAGSTYVFAIARTEVGPGIVSMPLQPTSGNITQLVYFLGDVACFLCFLIFASDPAGLKASVRALLLCAAMNLAFALIDVGGWVFQLGDLLSFLRNGTYRMLDEAVIGGWKRIVGSFPEASTFAYFTLGWFAFCTRLWLGGIHSWITGTLAALSLGALLFSTSSTGYAGSTAVVAALLVVSVGQVLTGAVSRQTLTAAIAVPIAAGALLIGLHLHAPTWQAIERIVDATVVHKLASDSGIERGRWNEQALVNFADTQWLGAGVGSVRASSFPVAVLGNIGAIGACTYGAFLLAVLFRRRNRWREPYPAACQSAARWACFAQLAGASVSGSFIDLGLPFFVFAGLASAAPAVRLARRTDRAAAICPAALARAAT